MKCNFCKPSMYLSCPLGLCRSVVGKGRTLKGQLLAWPFFASRVNMARIPECKIFLGPAAKLFNYDLCALEDV